MTLEEAASRDDSAQWEATIPRELRVLRKNNTWSEVLWPEKANVIESKWVFKIKSNKQYKARLVAKGFQQQVTDLYDVYAPVAKLTTFRILVIIANKLKLPIFQMDVQSAFLYGEITDEVFMSLPGTNRNNCDTVCKLNKSIYGLKKSPKCWNSKFNKLMTDIGFIR